MPRCHPLPRLTLLKYRKIGGRDLDAETARLEDIAKRRTKAVIRRAGA
jgi:hypothetical protein